VRLLLVVQPLGPPVQRELRGVVGAHARARDAAGDRADVDDRARRGAPQERQQRLGHADRRVEVLVHDLAHVRVAVVGITELAALAVTARVVHEQVEAVELRFGATRDSGNVIGVGQVGGLPDRADLAGQRLEAIGAARNEQQPPSV
jgi:hypothetical protein